MVSSKIMATMALLSAASALPSLMSRQDECPAWECEEDVANVLACAIDCVNESAPKFGCGVNDYNCACENFSALRSDAAICVIQSCGAGETTNVLDSLTALCSCVSTFPFSDAPCGGNGGGNDGGDPVTDPVDPPASTTPIPSSAPVTGDPVASVTGYPLETTTEEVPVASTTCTTDKEDAYVPTAPVVPVPTGGYPGSDKPTGDKPTNDKPTSDKPTGDYPVVDKPVVDKPNYGTSAPVPVPTGGYPSYPGANATVPAVPVGPKPTADKPTGDYPVTAGVAAKEVTIVGTLFAGLVAVVAAL